MPDQFSRTRLLLGAKAVDVLQHARVIVFGVGGVGGFAVEALARAGVGTIDLVDNDTVTHNAYLARAQNLTVCDIAAGDRSDI